MTLRRLIGKLTRGIAVRRLLPPGREPEWWREVARCQELVAAAGPHPYYLEKYRREEAWCWLHLARWLWDDGRAEKPLRCLDIGCAYGTLAVYCRRIFSCEVYCTDCTDEYLSPALARKYGLTFAVSDIETETPPWEGGFDVVIFSEVLEHLNCHPVPTLARIAGLLSQGGRLYLSTPDAAEWGRRRRYYASFEDMPAPGAAGERIDDHIYHYRREELARIVEAAGLRVARWAYSPGVSGRHHNLTLRKAPAA